MTAWKASQRSIGRGDNGRSSNLPLAVSLVKASQTSNQESRDVQKTAPRTFSRGYVFRKSLIAALLTRNRKSEFEIMVVFS